MTKFNTLDEMIKAYTKYYNNNCAHEDDFFTENEVKEICVERFFIPDAKAIGITLNIHSHHISGFGYVAV